MNIIKPYIELEDKIDGTAMLKKIERIGRTCYKSEGNITNDSAERFIKNIIKSGHESVLEHVNISVRIICDRGVTHELVRHRIASYSQESTRYNNYSKNKFNEELTFIKPCFWNEKEDLFRKWKLCMEEIEGCYLSMIEAGATPEQARSILPNSLKTEIVMTMNLREWRHFFKLRRAKAAHPQTREVANMILEAFKKEISIVFDDMER